MNGSIMVKMLCNRRETGYCGASDNRLLRTLMRSLNFVDLQLAENVFNRYGKYNTLDCA